MHLTADDLVAQFEQDWPQQAEISKLRAIVALQRREIERLTATASHPTNAYGQSFDRLEETRVDLPT